jgi:hypothetical protein
MSDDKRVAAALRGKARLVGKRDPARALTLLMLALELSVPVSDRLGEVAALAGIVVVAARAERPLEGARAVGALRAWLDRSGIVFSPWLTAKLRRGGGPASGSGRRRLRGRGLQGA